jgi:hypothetical protein
MCPPAVGDDGYLDRWKRTGKKEICKTGIELLLGGIHMG